MGSGCGSVGSGVAVRIQSSVKFVLNVYCQLYNKNENNEKEAGNGQSLILSRCQIVPTIDKLSRSQIKNHNCLA